MLPAIVPATRVLSLSMGEETPVVIVAEGDDDLRRDYEDWLRDEGYSVLTAANGLEAVELARMHLPALIVMKHDLPVLNGWEAMRAVRKDTRLDGTKIVALLTRAERWTRRHDLKTCGADLVLPAPCAPQALTVAVRGIVPPPDTASLIRVRVVPPADAPRPRAPWYALGRRR
jgi:CheY-like chemotaxis protein